MNEMIKEQREKSECTKPLATPLFGGKDGICVTCEEHRQEQVKDSDGLHGLMEIFLKGNNSIKNTGYCLIKNNLSKYFKTCIVNSSERIFSNPEYKVILCGITLGKSWQIN